MGISKIQQEYTAKLPCFEELSNIVSLKLSEIVPNSIHSIKFRVKDFTSFYEKISRKGYDNPFVQCTDIVGSRVILLFKSQIDELLAKIDGEFKILEQVRKHENVDTFSYGSIHLICKLKKPKKNLDFCFEIQIRTILQEAWAEIEHYLNYKHIGVDGQQLRKINALSALMEIADEQFQQHLA